MVDKYLYCLSKYIEMYILYECDKDIFNDKMERF